MEINAIQFEQGEEGAIPAEITVTMTLEEAVAIAHVFGDFTDKDLEDKGLPQTDIYSALTGDVFNRYWDDGLDGARREIGK